jgi:meiotically up-regulated gene 157 (Mug157) protein
MLTGVAFPWLLASAGVNQYMQSSYRASYGPFSKEWFTWYKKMFVKTR